MRIGVYGGAFSPVHNGHLLCAREFISQMSLDKLIIVPSCVPMMKNTLSPKLRLDMCRIAFKDEKCEISDIEILRGGKNYTYDTVKTLWRDGDEMMFLCGSDMAMIIDRWYKADELFKICKIAVACRRGDEAELCRKAEYLRARYKADIDILRFCAVDISSSKIREMIRRGDDVSSLIPNDEYEYIKKNGLYLYEEQTE